MHSAKVGVQRSSGCCRAWARTQPVCHCEPLWPDSAVPGQPCHPQSISGGSGHALSHSSMFSVRYSLPEDCLTQRSFYPLVPPSAHVRVRGARLGALSHGCCALRSSCQPWEPRALLAWAPLLAQCAATPAGSLGPKKASEDQLPWAETLV